MQNTGPLPVVILISGRGSNLHAIIDAVRNGQLDIVIRAVISNRPQAAGLQIARDAGVDTAVIDHTQYADRDEFDVALQECIDGYRPELVILAGFMRILTARLVEHYRGRLINIHPSLLPDLPGLDTHRRALEAGHSRHGASVHFVTPVTDAGPVIMQAQVPVLPGDSPDLLQARVLGQEHALYPRVIELFAERRIFMNDDGQIMLDGVPLEQPLQLEAETGPT